MNKKKILVYVGMLGVLGFCLTGCNAKEGEVKSVEKQNEVASIKLESNNEVSNNTSIKQEEKQVNNIVSSNENEGQVKESYVTSCEVVNVTHTEINTDVRYIVVSGYDKDGNVVWEYKTQKESPVPQFTTIEYIGAFNNEIVYINELGVIKGLDYKTGKVLFSNSEYKTGSSLNDIDLDGNLYLYGLENNVLFILNKNGKTVKRFEVKNNISNSDLPNAMNGGEMELLYENDKAKEIKIAYEGVSSSNKILSINLSSYKVLIK